MPEPTEYIVLSHDGEGAWRGYDRVKSTSADAAIRAAVKDAPPLVVTQYVAVPARSWKPVAVQAVQTTTLKLAEIAEPADSPTGSPSVQPT